MNKIFKTNPAIRWFPMTIAVMILLATLMIAHPVYAASDITVRCTTLTQFGSNSNAFLKRDVAAIQKSFDQQLSVMQSSWQLEDTAVAALRKTGESTFATTVRALVDRPGTKDMRPDERSAAINEYRTAMLDTLRLHQTNIDATRATYRKDMLALLKEHQDSLSSSVSVLTRSISEAAEVAKKNCNQADSIQAVRASIAKANNSQFVTAQQANTLAESQASRLVSIRNNAFDKEQKSFEKSIANATEKLSAANQTEQ